MGRSGWHFFQYCKTYAISYANQSMFLHAYSPIWSSNQLQNRFEKGYWYTLKQNGRIEFEQNTSIYCFVSPFVCLFS